MNRRLYRSRREEMIGGVAGGVAEYLDLDPSIVRVVWAVLALITGGVFFIVYVVMWIVVPQAPEMPEGTPGAPTGGERAVGTSAESPGWVPPSGWVAPAAHRGHRRSGGGSWIFGVILIGLGTYFLAREYFPEIDVDRLWPLGLVFLGLLLMVIAFRRRD